MAAKNLPFSYELEAYPSHFSLSPFSKCAGISCERCNDRTSSLRVSQRIRMELVHFCKRRELSGSFSVIRLLVFYGRAP